MAEIWDEQLIKAKYHLSVSKRLYLNFSNYEVKRFLSSCLSEMALSSTSLVNSVLLYLHHENGTRLPISPSARLEIFKRNGEKLLGEKNLDIVLLIFDVRRAQKDSPIELMKKDKILLLDRGEYKALTIERMGELLDGLEKAIKRFSDFSKVL